MFNKVYEMLQNLMNEGMLNIDIVGIGRELDKILEEQNEIEILLIINRLVESELIEQIIIILNEHIKNPKRIGL